MPKQKRKTPKNGLYVEKSTVNYWGKPLKYVMSQTMFNAMAEDCPKGMNPDQYILQCINETYGLLGHVTELSITEE
jgi:hypothetical protein